MTAFTVFIEALGRERTYDPISDDELVAIEEQARANLADPKRRAWGTDVLMLRLIQRIKEANAGCAVAGCHEGRNYALDGVIQDRCYRHSKEPPELILAGTTTPLLKKLSTSSTPATPDTPR